MSKDDFMETIERLAYHECGRCDAKLVPVLERPEGQWPAPTTQYSNAMHLRWLTGYGEFADFFPDPNPDFFLCHDCARLFLETFLKQTWDTEWDGNLHQCEDSGHGPCRFGFGGFEHRGDNEQVRANATERDREADEGSEG